MKIITQKVLLIFAIAVIVSALLLIGYTAGQHIAKAVLGLSYKAPTPTLYPTLIVPSLSPSVLVSDTPVQETYQQPVQQTTATIDCDVTANVPDPTPDYQYLTPQQCANAQAYAVALWNKDFGSQQQSPQIQSSQYQPVQVPQYNSSNNSSSNTQSNTTQNTQPQQIPQQNNQQLIQNCINNATNTYNSLVASQLASCKADDAYDCSTVMLQQTEEQQIAQCQQN